MLGQTTKGYRIKKKHMEDTFALPRRIIKKLAEASEFELKMLVVLASLELENEYVSESEFIEALEKAGVSSSEFSQGIAFLRGADFLEAGSIKNVEQKPQPEQKEGVKHTPSAKPSYTSAQLAKASTNTKFKDLVEYASARLGKMFNTSELSTLYSFNDYLCMPYDVIMLAIEHCVSEGKGSLRYVEKLLISFADGGIDTYQKAEEYIVQRKNYLSFEGKMRKMLGIGSRALLAKEKAFLSDWLKWNISDEMIDLAYERTIVNTSKPSIDYMNTIIKSWHVAGFTTVNDVKLGDKKPSSSSNVDFDDFFKVAVESSKK